MKTLVTDLTGVRFGLELKAFQALNASYSQDYDQVVLLCLESQKTLVPNDWCRSMRSVPDYLHFRQIAKVIEGDYVSPAVASPDVSLVVVTFHSAVLDIQSSLTPNDLTRVKFVRWQGLFPSAKPAVSDKGAAGRALAALMGHDDALAAIKRVLQRASAIDSTTGMQLAKLRPLLESEDSRFKKTSDAAKVSGIVGAVVQLAEERGLIASDRAAGPHFKVWLKPAGLASNGEAEVREEAGGNPDAKQAEDVDSPAPATRKAVSTERQRSDIFVDSLFRQGLGPFSRVRPLLYDKFNDAVAAGPKSATALLGEAVAATRNDAPATKAGEKEIPWRKVKEFLRALLERCAILLTNEHKSSPSVLSFENLRVPIIGLTPDWRLKLDGELVVALMKDGVKLHLGDVPHLAGALFNARTDASEEKTAEVVELLIKSKRVVTGPDRILQLVEVSSGDDKK
jgi:hypothetical protein